MATGYEVRAYNDLSVIAASMRQMVRSLEEISESSARTAAVLEKLNEKGDIVMGLHECPDCGYRFEDHESLRAHLEEGGGCPARK